MELDSLQSTMAYTKFSQCVVSSSVTVSNGWRSPTSGYPNCPLCLAHNNYYLLKKTHCLLDLSTSFKKAISIQTKIPSQVKVKVMLRLTVSPVSTSWCRVHSGTCDQIFITFCLKVSVLSLCGALSDDKSGLSLVSSI
jgi:hypothetical protein